MKQASKVKKFPACRKNFLTLDAQKHEEGAIYEVNSRIPNVFRTAGIAKQWSSLWLYTVKLQASKVKKFPACRKNFLTLDAQKHEEGAIYEVNSRIPQCALT